MLYICFTHFLQPAVAPRKNLLNDFWAKNSFEIEEPETTTTTTTEIPPTTYYVPETKPARPKFVRFPVKDHNETPSDRIHELVAFRDRTHKTAENTVTKYSNENRATEARDGYLSQDFALDRQKLPDSYIFLYFSIKFKLKNIIKF